MRKLDAKASLTISEYRNIYNQQIYGVCIELPSLAFIIEGETPLGHNGKLSLLEAGIKNVFDKLVSSLEDEKADIDSKLLRLK